MTQHVNDENGPRCANTEDRSEAQLSAEILAPSIPHAPEPVSPQAERFKRAEDDGIVAAARWIGHPSVREQVNRWRMPVHEIVEPAFGRVLAEYEDGVTPFAWAVYGMSGINPDLEPANAGWSRRVYLTPAEACLAPTAVRRFKKVVDKAAEGMHRAGAPVDLGWDGDLVVIATLLLAAPACIPWDLPAVEFAKWVYVPAATAITPDARGIRSRRHVSQASARNVLAIQQAYETFTVLGGKRQDAPYGRGQGRSTQARPLSLHDALLWALPQVREAFPRSSSIAEIRRRWPATDRKRTTATAGGRLQDLLEHKLGHTVDCPSRATLYRAFKALDLTP